MTVISSQPLRPIESDSISSDFRVDIDCANRVATLVGELDFATVNLLHEALEALLPVPSPDAASTTAANPPRLAPIRIDVTGLSFVDSCGLGALVTARKLQLSGPPARSPRSSGWEISSVSCADAGTESLA
jgi:anti-anti-sigma regulatory factor